MEGHCGRTIDCRSAGRLGAERLLAGFLSFIKSGVREAVGSNRRATSRHHLVCLFRRQHSLGGSAMEWRH